MSTFDKTSILQILTPEFITGKSPLKIIFNFWEEDRQRAFNVCYKSMRLLDNFIDDLKKNNNGNIKSGELKKLAKNYFEDWRQKITTGVTNDKLQAELLSTITEFNIPITPWEKLITAMIYDIDNNGFNTYDDFLNYTEGAAVAPGAVAMFLCGMKHSEGKYISPKYNIFDCARPLARFSYLVHIMRDFHKDKLDNLNYLATDLINLYGLSAKDLDLAAKKPDVINLSLIRLMRNYCAKAEHHLRESRNMLNKLRGVIDYPYLLSLEVLFGLYIQVFDKIKSNKGNYVTKELEASPQEMFIKIEDIVTNFSI